jgi:hypothetical protein
MMNMYATGGTPAVAMGKYGPIGDSNPYPYLYRLKSILPRRFHIHLPFSDQQQFL